MSRAVIRDAAVAAVVTVLVAVGTSHLEASGGERSLDALGFATVITAGGALAFRRRSPLGAVAIVTAALTIYVARNYVGGPIFVIGWLALFFLATSIERRTAFAVAAAVSTVLIVVSITARDVPALVHFVFVGWAAAAVFLGDATRSRQRNIAAMQERADHLEQTREQEARRRVAEERLRIARDLHDSVAHAMATINVQAGAAAHVIERQPQQAREALVAIQHASRDVLDELAALLGLLRLDPGEHLDRAPTPDLGRLDDLVAGTRRSGLDVRVDVRRPLDDVPKPVAMAAYRIVQESLTNVVRHAGAAEAQVTIGYAGTEGLQVEVEDNGGPAPHDRAGAGVGIVGMRERAEATGGSLHAGPRDGGGFRVVATWPAR